MPTYFDSSVLLSLLLGDAHASRAEQLWHTETDRVSSTLLAIECLTVLRRIPATTSSAGQRCELEANLRDALDEVTIKPLDESVVDALQSTPELGQCRSLDAAHLATALYYRAAAPNLAFCTFDDRMAAVASRLGFAVTNR